MRVIGQINSAKYAYLFTEFLEYQKIEARAEKRESDLKGQEIFDIWVIDEDQLERVKGYLDRFHRNPDDSEFSVPEGAKQKKEFLPLKGLATVPDEHPPKIRKSLKVARHGITKFAVFLCVALFIFSSFQSRGKQEPTSAAELIATRPVLRLLAYNVPEKWSLESAFLREHKMSSSLDVENLSPKELEQYRQIQSMPTWEGIYSFILSPSKKELLTPPFTKIREGEVWRLFTPILLHGGLIHLVFNMLWLWTLGKQLEERIKGWHYLVMTLIFAAVSNTAQYLVSGPLFLGYSGVLCGMIGFIWVRQQLAPWEGYPLQPMAVAFLAIFVLGLLALQIISFSLSFFGATSFSVGSIANTAHISGALCGLLLGRLSLFSKKGI